MSIDTRSGYVTAMARLARDEARKDVKRGAARVSEVESQWLVHVADTLEALVSERDAAKAVLEKAEASVGSEGAAR